jgi:hypothetical protein
MSDWLKNAKPIEGPVSGQSDSGNQVPSWRSKAKVIEESPLDRDLKANEGLVGYMGLPKSTTNSDIEEIAKRTGADPEVLKAAAPLLGATDASKDQSLADYLGQAGTALANAGSFGLLRKYIREQGGTPENIKGLEALQELADARRGGLMKIGELGVQSGIGLGNVARKASTATKIGRGALEGAGIGAAVGVGGSKSGEELSEGLKGAALGGVAGAALPAIIAGGSKASRAIRDKFAEEELVKNSVKLEDEAAKVLESNKNSDEALRSVVLEGRPVSSLEQAKEIVGREVDIPEEKLLQEAELRASETLQDFEKFLTGDKSKTIPETVASIKDYTGRNYGNRPESLNNLYNDFIQDKATRQAMDEAVLRTGDKSGILWRAQRILGGSQSVLQSLDDLAGTSTRKVARDLSQAGQKQAYVSQALEKKADTLFGNSLRSLSDDQMTKVFNALDTGDLSGIKQDKLAADAYTGIRKYLSDVRDLVNGNQIDGPSSNQKIQLHGDVAPLGVPKLENYVPHSVVKGPELEARIQDKINKVLEQNKVSSLRDLDAKNINLKDMAANNKDVQDLLSTVQMYRESPSKSFADLDNQLKDLVERRGEIGLTPKARAAMERNEGIPKYLLNTDLRELVRSYGNNLLSTAYQRKPIENLARQASYLKKLGMDSGADYLEKLIQDVRGTRTDTLASDVSNLSNKFQSSLDFRAKQVGYNTPEGRVYRMAASIPSVLNSTAKNIYGNVLGGFKLKSAVTNLTQPYSTVAPSIGGKYGYELVTKSLAGAAKNRDALLQRARSMGLVGPERTVAMRDAFASGIEASKAFQGSKYLADKATEIGMTLFQKSEELNRAITLQVADNMAADILKGNLKGLEKMPSSVRKDIMNLAKQGAPEELGNYIGSYLNSSTQFIYDKASMSAAGRYMGPLFSQFTKWPSETAGEILYVLSSGKNVPQKAARLLERFALPFGIFYGADMALEKGAGLEESDRYRQLVGKGGIRSSAQITSIAGLAGANASEVFTPPLLKSGQKIAGSALKSDSDNRLENTLNSILREGKIFLPASAGAYYRLLAEDIPTWVSGEKPEKK